jgi:pyrroline-5-carboxylate reductase
MIPCTLRIEGTGRLSIYCGTEGGVVTGKNIGCIGGGNMAEAIVRGLLAGNVEPANIMIAEPVDQRREYLSGKYGIRTVRENGDAAAFGEIVLLAVKPQVCMEALGTLTGDVSLGKLFISIMAGVKTETIESALARGARVVRVMPNTPALVLKAASAVAAGANATADDVAVALDIFNLLGTAHPLDEKLLDAVTGLSGSGPAYVYTFIEALSDAGVKNGLPRDIATRLAAQTVLGAAGMVLETGDHPALLREKVTSPGGTTIAGLHILEQQGFRGTIMSAVDTATARSVELGKK